MRRSSWFVCSVLLMVLGSKSSIGDQAKYVLVPDDVPVYIHPDDASAHFRASDPGDGGISIGGGIGAYRFVGKRGAFVEIESLPDAACEDQCVCAGWKAPGRLRLFVHADKLARGTLQEANYKIGSDGRVKLAAGVPVLFPNRGGPARVLVGEFFRMAVDVPLSEAGEVFARTPRLDRGAHAVAQTKRLMPLGLEPIVPMLAPQQLPIRSQKRLGDRVEVTVAFKCAELTFTTTTDHVAQLGEKSEPPVLLVPMQEAPPARFVAKNGARVFWPDGTAAGSTEGSFGLDKPQERGRRVCSDVKFGGSKDRLTICFDPNDVHAAPAAKQSR